MRQEEGGTLYGFLRQVSEEPDRLEAFRADPEAAMDEAGLAEHHKEAIRSGDRGRVEQLLHEEGLEVGATYFCQALED